MAQTPWISSTQGEGRIVVVDVEMQGLERL